MATYDSFRFNGDLDDHPIVEHLEPEIHKGRQGKTMAIIAIIIAVAALLAIIAFFIIWLIMRHQDVNQGTGWKVHETNKSTYKFTPDGNDLLRIEAGTGTSTITIARTSNTTTPIEGRMFIIDNTQNSSAVTVKADSGLTLVDDTSSGPSVEAHTSGTYMWSTTVPSGERKPTTFYRII